MALPIAIILGLIVFVGQIMLCFRTRKTHLRAIPAMVMTALMVLCAVIYVFRSDVFGISFATVIDVVIIAVLLVVDAFGWLTYCIIRFVQKVS